MRHNLLKIFSASAVWTSALSWETYDSFSGLLSRQEPVLSELGSLLSPNASIILPGSSDFANATQRWQEWKDPNITIVVKVVTEQDVQETVSPHPSNFQWTRSSNIRRFCMRIDTTSHFWQWAAHMEQSTR